jgi:DNA-binding Lrp family transcriptional regulator
MTETIVAYLRANAEQLDVDMAEALNIPLAELREEVARLAASGDVICCRVTRFIEGRKIEGSVVVCRAIRRLRRADASRASRRTTTATPDIF